MTDAMKIDLLALWVDYKSGKINQDVILNYVQEVYETEKSKLLGEKNA
tara:strand:- start:599 stop:742 length:144 start_codon:yes stop_codon:yes gene_type:complete